MPAPQQPKTPIYKETSNVTRFNTNYYKHDERKQAGYALAKALGAASGLIAQQAKKKKAEDLEQGKLLAMMGVERENLAEASGKGKGPFSLGTGWTMQGYDMQRGVEDAYLNSGEIIDAYNKSNLWKNDDPVAFQQWIGQQREAVFKKLEGVSDSYRDGYMNGIAQTFQKAARTHAGHMTTFRQSKKLQSFRSQIASELKASKKLGKFSSASYGGKKKQAEKEERLGKVAELLENAPKTHGINHSDAKKEVANAVEQAVKDRDLSPEEAVLPENLKIFPKANQRRIEQAAESVKRQTELENEQKELANEERKRKTFTTALDDKDPEKRKEALAVLHDEFPEQYEAALYHQNAAKRAPTASERFAYKENLNSYRRGLAAMDADTGEEIIADALDRGEIGLNEWKTLNTQIQNLRDYEGLADSVSASRVEALAEAIIDPKVIDATPPVESQTDQSGLPVVNSEELTTAPMEFSLWDNTGRNDYILLNREMVAKFKRDNKRDPNYKELRAISYEALDAVTEGFMPVANAKIKAAMSASLENTTTMPLPKPGVMAAPADQSIMDKYSTPPEAQDKPEEGGISFPALDDPNLLMGTP